MQMDHEVIQIAGQTVLLVGARGQPIALATDLIGEAFSAGAQVVAIPAARLDPEFFRLASGIAGEMLQKFVNYGIRPVIVGDVAGHVAASNALADFIRESNRGSSVWFVPDMAALETRLS
jgi:hypothetical protein